MVGNIRKKKMLRIFVIINFRRGCPTALRPVSLITSISADSYEFVSALDLSCPEIYQRYLQGSPMCFDSLGIRDLMLMWNLTKTYLA